MRIRRAVLVSVLLAIAAVNLLAACTPADDADAFETPEVQEPTPVPATHCQVVWSSQNSQLGSRVDVFVIDGPAEAWIAGVNTFGAFTAYYQPGLDVSGDSFPTTLLDTRGGVVTSTAGSFEIVLTLNETDEGAAVGIAQLTSATLMTIGTDGEPTEDELGRTDGFTFDGEWSSREPLASWELGTGTADLLLGTGTSAMAVGLGDYGSFAICYDDAGNAITSAQQTLMRGRH